ncbi:MAG: ABC transporter ATP-binding protein [Firmicutes bacterium]|nr:ABC transporter ATP-binding protein [Bacillota bacterium]
MHALRPVGEEVGAVPVAETRDVHREYHVGNNGLIRALQGVTLQVRAGEMVAVMGPSGSGKSTLLNLMGCLDRPTRGAIILGGQDVSTIAPSEIPNIRRTRVGFVFQQYFLIPTLTALENIMLPLKYAGVNRSTRAAMAKAELERVGLSHRALHRPSELSGGEQQRVAIARALVNRPAVVLADEPTGELDSVTSHEIITMMQRFSGGLGQAFVIVTHDPDVASVCSRILQMKDGQIVRETR